MDKRREMLEVAPAINLHVGREQVIMGQPDQWEHHWTGRYLPSKDSDQLLRTVKTGEMRALWQCEMFYCFADADGPWLIHSQALKYVKFKVTNSKHSLIVATADVHGFSDAWDKMEKNVCQLKYCSVYRTNYLQHDFCMWRKLYLWECMHVFNCV
jgi:hypothetical protein